MLRGAAFTLAFTSTLVAVCSLLHFSDLRWLVPGQRGSVHVSSPAIFGGFGKSAAGVVNSVADVPAEWRATQVSIGTAIHCGLLALLGFTLVLVTRRWARRGEIRLVVNEELDKRLGRRQ